MTLYLFSLVITPLIHHGGGIRGISSLLILEDIMKKMRDMMGLDRVPRPCECFNMIGGTSTGGKVAQQAFTPKRTTILPASPSGAFSAKALEAAIKQTVRDFYVQPECVARRAQGLTPPEACLYSEMAFRDRSCTKTVVLTITKDNEVAWATSAAITFFKPIRVGRDGIEFVNARFRYNNLYEVLVEEARR
ncbi:hypothetical protein QBC46DRAFT_457725 [Diplogelasinospora grovesii]|uniref:Uncharacterized protein n=1 Tax=Diplogelasinospora grovesii TaxID=303347 RepID=A0AAN6NAB8_9PEZI|nr:hypothetical protein QBC46DRAFT_457725 [Diplogelasinospora grovesii]